MDKSIGDVAKDAYDEAWSANLHLDYLERRRICWDAVAQAVLAARPVFPPPHGAIGPREWRWCTACDGHGYRGLTNCKVCSGKGRIPS